MEGICRATKPANEFTAGISIGTDYLALSLGKVGAEPSQQVARRPLADEY